MADATILAAKGDVVTPDALPTHATILRTTVLVECRCGWHVEGAVDRAGTLWVLCPACARRYDVTAVSEVREVSDAHP